MLSTGRVICGRGLLVALLVIAGGLPAGAEVRHMGSYAASAAADAIRYTDAADPANIHLIEENFRFTTTAASAAFGDGLVFVTDENYLQVFDRGDLITGPAVSWDAGATLLDVEAGIIPGQVLLLTRNALQIVDLNGPTGPRVVSSLAANNQQVEWSNLLTVFGNTVYVADHWLKGFRVIDITDEFAPVEIATYTTAAKVPGNLGKSPVTDLRRDGNTLMLVVGGHVELVQPDNLLKPTQFTSLGSIKLSGTTAGALREGYAFVAAGATVRLIDVTPGSAGFMTEMLSFTANADITDLQLRRGRLYLLCGNVGYEIWDVSDYMSN